MEYIVLDDDQDLAKAADHAFSGRMVHVEVGFEMGPDGPEPKVELLRVLLDQVQRLFAVDSRQYLPHPFVDSRYLRSCVIDPARRPGTPGGVREPRRPRPDPVRDAVALPRPEHS
ncbi:MAG: hypothetical protein GY724_14690 [Actinomycetia bacterium]|nr:hypothetical protein [Actinomycetes bacterium]MCP5035166.1 hypothetical protein [Actinomycetes bacterium]